MRISIKDGFERHEQREASLVVCDGDVDAEPAAEGEAAAVLAGVGGEHRQPHQRLPHSGPRVHTLATELLQARAYY